MSLWDWIKKHILHQKPSDRIKKEFKITYWTVRDNEARIFVDSIRFVPAHRFMVDAYFDEVEVTQK